MSTREEARNKDPELKQKTDITKERVGRPSKTRVLVSELELVRALLEAFDLPEQRRLLGRLPEM